MTVAPPRPIRLRSTRSTRTPCRVASIAAYMPAAPEPMIRTSVSMAMGSVVMPLHYGVMAGLVPAMHDFAPRRQKLFRQRLAVGFRQEHRGDKAQRVDAGNRHRRMAEAAELH